MRINGSDTNCHPLGRVLVDGDRPEKQVEIGIGDEGGERERDSSGEDKREREARMNSISNSMTYNACSPAYISRLTNQHSAQRPTLPLSLPAHEYLKRFVPSLQRSPVILPRCHLQYPPLKNQLVPKLVPMESVP